jgi:chromosome segregation ATPase
MCDNLQNAADAWDRFLQKHEDELVNLRRISKERKDEVARLNQKLADAQQELLTLQEQLYNAKWVEDSLRFEIDVLREALVESESELSSYRKRDEHPMLEVRQAHQEADQWQRRCENALNERDTAVRRLNGLLGALKMFGDVLKEQADIADWEDSGFKPVNKTYVNGEEIDAATDRHWRERDK